MRERVWSAGLLSAGALPLLVARPAPLQDWPNHVARVPILHGLLQGEALWERFYRLTGFLVPDAALDLGLLGLGRLGMPAPLAAQAFLLATYLVFVACFCALARALGAYGPVKPAFAVLLFYCHALFWGLVVYMLGAGLMLGSLALWLPAGRLPHARPGVALGGAVLLLFTHVIAAVAWVVVLACFEGCGFLAIRGRGTPRAPGLSFLAALIAIAIALRAMPGGTGHDFQLAYAGGGFGGALRHKAGILARVLLGGSLVQDASSALALGGCTVLAWVARPRLAAAPASAAAALLVLTLAAPERLGTGSVLDTRLAILPLLLLAAAVRIEPRRPAIRLASAAVLARTLVLAAYWHAAGLVFGDFRRAIAGLPPGGVMMVAFATRLPSLSWQQIWSPAITSLATQAVFRGLFVPAIFANPAQQPIALRARYQPLAQPWNLTDAAHLQDSARSLAALCRRGTFTGVYLTVLYPGTLASGLGAALLHAEADFLILDACRLPA